MNFGSQHEQRLPILTAKDRWAPSKQKATSCSVQGASHSGHGDDREDTLAFFVCDYLQVLANNKKISNNEN